MPVTEMKKTQFKPKQMKTFLTLILVLCSINLVKADMGSSALYKCRIDIGSSDLLTGYFQIATFDTLPTTGDNLLSFLKKVYPETSFLKLYSQIVPLDHPTLEPELFKFSATPIEEIKLVNAEKIQSLTILDITSSECFKAEGADTFEYSKTEFLIGLHHPIIELTRAEIYMLNSQRPFHEHYRKMESWDIDAILVVSYNPDLDENSFRDLSQKLIFVRNKSLSYLEQDQAREKQFKEVRNLLRQHKIILIPVMSYT